MNDDRLDLSPLDPAEDGARWDALVEAVAAGARAQVLRYGSGPLDYVVRWRRRAIVSAALAASAAVIALAVGDGRRSSRAPTGARAVTALLGVPTAVTPWLRPGGEPEPLEVYVALHGGRGGRGR